MADPFANNADTLRTPARRAVAVVLPAPLAQGVVALIAHLYEDRGRATQPPAAVTALWRPYRRLRLATERRS